MGLVGVRARVRARALEAEAEAEALVASFEAYPLNIGCLRGSNAGAPLPGVCY